MGQRDGARIDSRNLQIQDQKHAIDVANQIHFSTREWIQSCVPFCNPPFLSISGDFNDLRPGPIIVNIEFKYQMGLFVIFDHLQITISFAENATLPRLHFELAEIKLDEVIATQIQSDQFRWQLRPIEYIMVCKPKFIRFSPTMCRSTSI